MSNHVNPRRGHQRRRTERRFDDKRPISKSVLFFITNLPEQRLIKAKAIKYQWIYYQSRDARTGNIYSSYYRRLRKRRRRWFKAIAKCQNCGRKYPNRTSRDTCQWCETARFP